MNIVVIGSGGREHTIAWKLSQSPLADKIFVLPGNGGTENNLQVDMNDFEQILNFCKHNTIQLIFVGPEVPLANGIVDYFKETPVLVFGPEKEAAVMESSKIWSKKFMEKYGVSTADFWEFTSADVKQTEKVLEMLEGNCVIKYDGLAAGKGVFVCSNITEAQAALDQIQDKYGKDAAFLIEKKLLGKELSLLAFTDGKNYKLLLSAQDHKQLLDGDRGPNTGGMGAYCPVPFLDNKLKKQIKTEIIEPTMQGITAENFNYKGVIYFGLMITKNGPKLLEYNVRLGDPETEVVLPALKNDLLKLVLSCFDGTIENVKMKFNKGYYIDVVLTSGGYPRSYDIGYEINGLEDLGKQTLVFHAGTKKDNDKLVTNGGRVLNIVKHGNFFAEARKSVYKECEKIYFEKKYYRKDIGARNP